MVKNTKSTPKRKASYSLRRVVDMIKNHGATWRDVEVYAKCKHASIQRRLKKEHYTTAEGYDRLLGWARENAKKKKQVAELLTTSPAEEVHEVILTETGYLMKVGVEGILNESLDIIIPSFCVNELTKLEKSFSSAEDVLGLIWTTNRITRINLKEEILFEEPTFKVKDRTLGIVALCCHLYSNDMKVRLLTTSYEVMTLVAAQGFPPEDVKVEFVSKTAK